MKYSIVFPGQGSQSLGMLSDLNQNFTIVNETFQELPKEVQAEIKTRAEKLHNEMEAESRKLANGDCWSGSSNC